MYFVIDGNHFFNRSVFTSVNFNKSGTKKFLSSEKDQIAFIKKVVIDIFAKVKILKPQGIIFTFDGKSWRKDVENLNPEVSILIKDKLDFSYKENREAETEKSNIDWPIFYKLIDEFIAILNEKGFLSIKRYGLEGDDICFLLAEKLLSLNEDTIIISADSDMRTLAKTTEKNYIIAYNPVVKDKGLFVPPNFETWMLERDANANVFDFNLEVNPLSHFKTDEIVEIDSLKMNFLKIFLGKSNESVPTVYTWKTNTNENRKLTDRIVNLIYDKVLVDIPDFDMSSFEDISKRDIISQILLKIIHKKDYLSDDPMIKPISDRILVNYYMKFLSEKTLPKQLVTDFNKILIKTRTIKNGIEDILADTRFSEKKTSSSNLFDLLD